MIEGVEADLFRGGVTGCLRGSKCWIGAAHAGQAPGDTEPRPQCLAFAAGPRLLLRPPVGCRYCYGSTGQQACRAPGDTAAIALKRRRSEPRPQCPRLLRVSRWLLVSPFLLVSRLLLRPLVGCRYCYGSTGQRACRAPG